MIWYEQVGYALLTLLGVGYAIIQILHTFTFPLSEEKTREIIREELRRHKQNED